jgi:hypothetical protein
MSARGGRRHESDEVVLARLRSENDARIARYRMFTYLGLGLCLVVIIWLSQPIAEAFAGQQTGISLAAGTAGGLGLSLTTGGSIVLATKKGKKAKEAEARTQHLTVQLVEARDRVRDLEADLAGVRGDLDRQRAKR